MKPKPTVLLYLRNALPQCSLFPALPPVCVGGGGGACVRACMCVHACMCVCVCVCVCVCLILRNQIKGKGQHKTTVEETVDVYIYSQPNWERNKLRKDFFLNVNRERLDS